MKHITKIAIVSFLLIVGCDKVKEDDPTAPITLESLRYARENSPMIIPIWGDFDDADITILSSSELANQLETYDINDDVRFLKYLPGTTSDLIDIQVLQNEQVIGNGSVEIRLLGENDCADTGFSDYHRISPEDTLEVDLMGNDALCNWEPTSNAIVRLTFVDPITLGEEPQISELTGSSAILNYSPPAGFTGRLEFVYELCFGWEIQNPPIHADEIGEQVDEVLLDPLGRCQFYYVALATIDVVDK